MNGSRSNQGPTARASTEPRASARAISRGLILRVRRVPRIASPVPAEYSAIDDLFYIGVTPRSTPLAVREHLHASPEKQRAMLARLSRFAPGRMVLATCERLEVYASTTHATSAEWIAALADWFHVQPELLARYAVVRRGGEVIDHWCRVSAGLDSRILGEPHVLGQVRAAYAQATAAGSLDSTLYALGRTAIRVGKRVRAETAINEARRSIATLAVEHVCKTVENLSDASVVVTGTGHLASDVVDELARRGTGHIVIAGRTEDYVRILANKCRGAALNLADLPRAIADTDVLISCTAAPSYIVEPATIGSQRDHDLRIIDLSVPRNVDPDVGRLPRVTLTTLEYLLGSEAANHTGIADAERIIDEERTRFEQWCHRRNANCLVLQEICA